MIEDLIQRILQDAPARISFGLSPDDAVVAMSEFERLIRIAIGSRDTTTFPNFNEMALRIGARITQEVSEVPPEKRLEYIQQELLVREVGSLNWEAWNIAEKSLQEAPDLPALQAQARVILDKIIQIHCLLKEKGSEWERRFGRDLSEATLDCEFVLGDHSRSSLRLGRTIRFLQKKGVLPPPSKP